MSKDGRGWWREPERHALARRGIRTAQQRQKARHSYLASKLAQCVVPESYSDYVDLSDFANMDIDELTAQEREALDELILADYPVDSVGSYGEIGEWYGLVDLEGENLYLGGEPVVGAILTENSGGRDVTYYTNKKELNEDWEYLEKNVPDYGYPLD